MTKNLEIGKYKLSYTVKYELTYYDPFAQKLVTKPDSFKVKSEKVNIKKAGDLKNFFRKKAHQALDNKLSSYGHINSYKLKKIAAPKVVKLIDKQVFDVVVDFDYHIGI